MVMTNKKPAQGRQKIAIAKISKRSNLQVTFSKRCSGLFKKASDLCTLCGVDIAILVFSPSKKPFSFGHPSVEALIERFLSPSLSSCASSTQQAEGCREGSIEHELNVQLAQIEGRLEAEKKRGEALEKMRKDSQGLSQCWWENPVEELGLDELQILQAAMEELKNNVAEQGSRLNGPANCSVPFFTRNDIQLDHHLSERKFAEMHGSHGSMIPPSTCTFGSGSYGHDLF